MTRLMSVKKNLKKALLDSMDDPDKVFQIWANNMQWHHFLDKKPSIFIHYSSPYIVGLYCESFFIKDEEWVSIGLHIHYNWLKDEFETWTSPEIELNGEATVLGDPINPWELPGQRFLENFHFYGGT